MLTRLSVKNFRLLREVISSLARPSGG